MDPPNDSLQLIEKGGVVPVVRLSDLSRAVDLTQSLLDGGVTVFELTMTSPGAPDALALLLDEVAAFGDSAAQCA